MQNLEEGEVINDGVRLHYASQGKGPLVVCIHGFPDFWYSWRHQMEALGDSYRVVAYDQRGYNLSDRPQGQAQYNVRLLMSDLAAVIRHFGVEKAIVVGHDWGGLVAWFAAMFQPDLVDRLIVCNLPHPEALSRELTHNAAQRKMSGYARVFQKENAAAKVTPDLLVGIVAAKETQEVRERYHEAFVRSDIEAMLHYYKENFPQEPYQESNVNFPKVKAPTLVIHGLQDIALHQNGLNNTWEHVDADLTIVTVPTAGHWVHHDAKDLVNGTMRSWLAQRA
jgi:pimeloyl-ACP methyl ester carboxylesterase